MLILNIDVESAKNCIGNSCHIVNGKKKTPVILNLQANNFTIASAIDLYKKSNIIEAISYDGVLSVLEDIPMEDREEVYINYECQLDVVNEQTVTDAVNSVPDGITCICRLPDDFNDMKFIFDMCSKFDNLRFSGGYLFRLDSCRLGVLSEDNIKSTQVKITKYIATGDCNIYKTIDYDSDMQLVVSSVQSTEKPSKSEKKGSSSSNKSKSSNSKSSKKSSIKQAMSNLLFSDGIADL